MDDSCSIIDKKVLLKEISDVFDKIQLKLKFDKTKSNMVMIKGGGISRNTIRYLVVLLLLSIVSVVG
jgi:hypothetical protein